MNTKDFAKLVQSRLNEYGAKPPLVIDGEPGTKTLAALNEVWPAKVTESSMDRAGQSVQADVSGNAANLDARSLKNITTLHAVVRPLAVRLAEQLFAQGHQIQIISGTRTAAEQNALYAKGRTTAGPRVTNAKAGYSNHNFGIAFDIGFFRSGKYLDTEVTAGRFASSELIKLYALAGKLGKALGLEWGGDWRSFKDTPHFQYRPAWASGMNESAMLAELRAGRAIA